MLKIAGQSDYTKSKLWTKNANPLALTKIWAQLITRYVYFNLWNHFIIQ
jgi:hypothetical protein